MMNLQCRTESALSYKSASQIAGILGEDWCKRELYCPACSSECLSPSRRNTPAIDFVCPVCDQPYQLKSSKSWNLRKIVDAGYEAMMRSIRADKTPNLLLLHYSPEWCVKNLLLIPRMFFTESVVEKRKPLNPSARRAGWVGCNILLGQIPSDGKIQMVSNGIVVPIPQVLEEFARVRALAELPPSARGWTVDVLNLIRRLGKPQFSLAELYEFEFDLTARHPRNQNIRPKIRQQLQILRDMGFLRFTGPGKYAVIR